MGNNHRSHTIRRRREYLWKQNPHCHWCGRKTIPPEEVTVKLVKHGAVFAKEIRYEPLMATLDHLNSRFVELLGEPLAGNIRDTTVLACRECNNKRGKEEAKTVSKEALYALGGRRPKNLELAARIRGENEQISFPISDLVTEGGDAK